MNQFAHGSWKLVVYGQTKGFFGWRHVGKCPSLKRAVGERNNNRSPVGPAVGKGGNPEGRAPHVGAAATPQKNPATSFIGHADWPARPRPRHCLWGCEAQFWRKKVVSTWAKNREGGQHSIRPAAVWGQEVGTDGEFARCGPAATTPPTGRGGGKRKKIVTGGCRKPGKREWEGGSAGKIARFVGPTRRESYGLTEGSVRGRSLWVGRPWGGGLGIGLWNFQGPPWGSGVD